MSILLTIYYIALFFLVGFFLLLRIKKITVSLNYRYLFYVGIILMPVAILTNSFAFLFLSSIFTLYGLVNSHQWGRNASGKNGKIVMGKNSYGDPKMRVWNRKDAVITIGKYCSLADNIRFVVDGNHKTQLFSTFPFLERLGWKEYDAMPWGKENPSVGNDVWIGSDAIIYSGVHIGDGAVVAGQSVVTKSVPPYAVVAGNPATIKKYRFNEAVIEKLLRGKWWDLPEDTIREKIIPHAHDILKVCEALEEIKR